ncbi:hypothetical protein [Palleronia caenipelagi]|uniref:Uncharacterized protein n=1 Tax=Palleronia caenipelagi TaxID=2489174 RepID=A0A547PL82_9RHOB|nr:hypothetical protein [Palleronia caenipelagi]TRD14910.1 hypothetical protein FEV53_18125 [Palleronia caenipelagi]
MNSDQVSREHFFYVSVARFVFLHPDYGIVSVRDPIRLAEAESYGLSPLLIYGLTVAGLPLRWLTFSKVDEPRPIQSVLSEAWSHGEGLRGLPDTLRVNRNLAAASPDLGVRLSDIGVRLAICDTKDKSHPAALRSAQTQAQWLSWQGSGRSTVQDPVDALNKTVAQDHREDTEWRALTSLYAKKRQQMEHWLSLPFRDSRVPSIERMDWTPGPWLYPQEATIPPNQPRYFHTDDRSRDIWLLTGQGHDADHMDTDCDSAGTDLHEVAALAQNIVDCWPNPPEEIATAVGVTHRQLRWFLSARADLDKTARYRLEDLLGIDVDELTGCLTALGPYVLIARKRKAVDAIYNEISDGGDASPFELLPRTGSADPSWRYILINAFGRPPSFVMVPRGDRLADQLDSLIVNFSGPLSVSRSLYQDVVSTCARACRSPEANIASMDDFARRHHQLWRDCVWQPE